MNTRNKRHYKILLFLVIVSLLPIIFTWGRVVIGGDIMIPLNSSSIEKYLYQWISTQNGIYFSINYYPLFFFYKIVNFFNFSTYSVSFFLLFILNFIAGYGIYKLIKLFYGKEEFYLYLIPILFYIISPALLNGWHYMYFYSVAPFFFYFIFKIIKSRKVTISDLIYVNLIIFIASLDLPNPKYLFYLFFATVTIFVFGYFLRLIKFVFFVENLQKIVIACAFLGYLIVPVAYFASHYSPEMYGISVKAGYKDIGSMMDYGSSTIGKMFRLHHDGLNLDSHSKKAYLENNIIILLSYIFIIIALVNLISRGKNQKELRYNLIVSILIISFLFFAGGPNPPFGLVYEFIVTNFSLFGFLRTTAGAVFLLSILYSISIFIFLRNVKKNKKTVFFCMGVIIVVVGYPMLNGQFFKNISASTKEAKKDYGYIIPEEYFLLNNEISKNKIDSKMLFSKMDPSYVSTSWGYFGPLFYNFIYNDNIVSGERIFSNIYNHNVNLVIIDKSLIGKKRSFVLGEDKLNKIKDYNFLNLSSVDSANFLPHFYAPEKVVVSGGEVKDLPRIVSWKDWEIRSAVFFENQNPNKFLGEFGGASFSGNKKSVGDGDEWDSEFFVTKAQDENETESGEVGNYDEFDVASNNNQILEFKKINPTKYRVRVHGASEKFPLVFSESFHEGWKVYLNQKSKIKNQKELFAQSGPASGWRMKNGSSLNLSDYKILDGNEGDQASKEELVEYIENGWVSDLGDGKEREIKHQRWNSEKQKEELDYIEKYTIDFVSKNFQGTIQNDNLSKGNVFETWFEKPLTEEKHLMANGYANSWVIDPEEICLDSNKNDGNVKCIKNADGTYDFELIVEFWPQRLFYIGAGISLTTLLCCLGYLGYDFYKNKKRLKLNRSKK